MLSGGSLPGNRLFPLSKLRSITTRSIAAQLIESDLFGLVREASFSEVDENMRQIVIDDRRQLASYEGK